MSGALPTEEDVLAFLVLNAALGELMIGARSEEHQAMLDAISNWKANEWSDGVEGIVYERLLSRDRIHTAAIADSERRYAVECAEREVLEAAEVWRDSQPAPHTHNVPTFTEDLRLYRRVDRLRLARGSR